MTPEQVADFVMPPKPRKGIDHATDRRVLDFFILAACVALIVAGLL